MYLLEETNKILLFAGLSIDQSGRLKEVSRAHTLTALGNVYTGFAFLKIMNLPSSVYNMLPYIISLIVLAFTSKTSRAPKAEGIPYDKGQR